MKEDSSPIKPALPQTIQHITFTCTIPCQAPKHSSFPSLETVIPLPYLPLLEDTTPLHEAQQKSHDKPSVSPPSWRDQPTDQPRQVVFPTQCLLNLDIPRGVTAAPPDVESSKWLTKPQHEYQTTSSYSRKSTVV
jgi:hypothetical protein